MGRKLADILSRPAGLISMQKAAGLPSSHNFWLTRRQRDVAGTARWSQSKDLNSICFVSREGDKGGLKVFFKMALKPGRRKIKERGGVGGFQVPVLGGTLAAVPGSGF